MHTDYIKLDPIRGVFKEYFGNFSIELPEQVKPWEKIFHVKSGWEIIYSLGYDERQIPCLYLSAYHKMTNPRYLLINEKGEYKSFDYFLEAGNQFDYNLKVASCQRLNGIGSNSAFNWLASLDNLKDYHDFHFFLGTSSLFSLWHKCTFHAYGLTFNTALQYMMYQKALLFKNYKIATKILETTNAGKQKKLGRQISSFDDNIWKENCKRIVYEAFKLKFLQNDDLLNELLNTGDKLLLEANPDDLIWGIGLHADDERAKNKDAWRGTNWLGCILTVLKEDINR